MVTPKKTFDGMKWATRVLAIVILILSLPLYFSNGNPLPFVKPEYTVWDNIKLTIYPVMFIGLGLGLKFPKAGGYVLTGTMLVGILLGLLLKKDLSAQMVISFFVGIQFLMSGYVKRKY